MHLILLCGLAAALLLVPAVGSAQVTGPDLRAPAGKDWPAVGGDFGNSRYSTLSQINTSNIKQLKGAWTTRS
jgi:glucose dehydrogenase